MDVKMVDTGHSYAMGIPLLEVLSVSITKIGDERRTELYGTIRVTDGRGTAADLYGRGLQNSESLNPNETLTLTGPPRCISASTGFTIDVDLKDKIQNLEISRGRICWNKKMEGNYNKFLTLNVGGRHGFATVRFAVFDLATQAIVKVEFRGKGDSKVFPFNADFYGNIIAYYGKSSEEYKSSSDDKKYFRTTLFNRSAGNCLKLEAEKLIPLQRSVVAVPARASLVVEAKLFCGESNDEILSGVTSKFVPSNHYESEIEGKDFIANVRVRWCRPSKEMDFK